jgi:hypothetical protein
MIVNWQDEIPWVEYGLKKQDPEVKSSGSCFLCFEHRLIFSCT